MQTFIQQANAYGALRQPFFFLIDFEQNKPLICSFDKSADRKSTRLNSSHSGQSRMPSSA